MTNGDHIVISLIALAVAAAIAAIVRRRKHSTDSCSGNCFECRGCSNSKEVTKSNRNNGTR